MVMEDIETLRTTRAAIKGKITRIANFVQNYDPVKCTKQDLQVRSEELSKMMDRYEEIQISIEKMDSPDRQQVNELDRETTETKYYSTKAQIALLSGSRQLMEQSHLNSTTLHDCTARKPRVKLPLLELPKFDGDIREWPAFKNIFYASVDSVDIPTVNKLQYLKSALSGEAAGLITSLLITEENYSKALDILAKSRTMRNISVQNSSVCRVIANIIQVYIWIVLYKFATCVNASTSSSYNLSAHLLQLDYCSRGAAPAPLTPSQRAFAGLLATLLGLAAVCTALDLTLPDHAKKGAAWALAWSLPACWRALHAPAPRAPRTQLASLDGLRVLAMLVVIVEHVCWIATQSYLTDTRKYEEIRGSLDVILMTNSTLVVQIFFIMSSFLLAHKLLQQRRRGEDVPPLSTFVETMVNRIIRVSPSYWVVVWFAATWWERGGSGPLWAPLVGREAAVCRRKWWTHLLYLNNVLHADDKCLIQTWYLAADMQLYALGLALTLALRRWRRAGVALLGALLAASLALLFGLAYTWQLVPTYVMHRPESVRLAYHEESSFNVLYQSPLGNVPGALAGLLLAHVHHMLLDMEVDLPRYKVFGWVSVAAVPAAVCWVAAPLALARGPPARLPAAALAALERPVFSLFVATALLGAMNGIPSAVARCLSWRGWAAWARLSFGALLLHMPINKALVAARLMTSQLDRQAAVLEWFGVAALSYLAALPLALLVELPAQRLTRALRRPPAPPPAPPAEKTDD